MAEGNLFRHFSLLHRRKDILSSMTSFTSLMKNQVLSPHLQIQPIAITTVLSLSTHMLKPVSGYMLGEETQAGEYVALGHVFAEEFHASSYTVHVHEEESDTIDDYTVPEPQEAVSEHDYRTDEIPADEPVASLSNSTSMVRDQPSALSEEPVGDRLKLTYASILRFVKGQPDISVPHAAPLRKTTPLTTDTPPATPHPILFTRPEKSSSDAAIDVTTAVVEDEGRY